MQGTLVGLYQNEFKKYPAFWLNAGTRFDWCLRKPIFLPWGGTTPATVFMLDPGGALGLPTTLTAQPGGWNVIAYTTWTAFAAGCAGMVSGRGDWALFPGAKTITPDAASVDFLVGAAKNGKNAAYHLVVGSYDASSQANALNMNLANLKTCKIDYSAITWPATFISWAATVPATLSFVTWGNIFVYAPLQANQVTAFNSNATGQNFFWSDLVSWGGVSGQQYNANGFNYGDEPLTAGALTSVGTACTITNNIGIASWLNNLGRTGQGTSTFIVSSATQTAYNGQFTFTLAPAQVPTSITSVGAVATINLVGIGTAVAAGQTRWFIQDTIPAGYAGLQPNLTALATNAIPTTLTASGADAATYPITSTGGAPATTVGTATPCVVTYTALSTPSTSPATGSVVVTPPFASIPDAAVMLNVYRDHCGFGYCAGFGSVPTGTQGKIQDIIAGSNRNVYNKNVIHHHAGWKQGTVRYPVPSVPSTITSSGTTATINLTGIGTLVTGGQTAWDISGMTPSTYNGKYTLTASGANAATYTFAGTAGAPVTVMGSIYPQNGTAQVGLWNGVTPITATSASVSAGVCTVLTTNTSTLAVGGWASMSIGFTVKGACAGVFQVTGLVTNTSFTVNCDPRNSGVGSGTFGDAQSNGWVAAQGDAVAGNGYNHSDYFGDQNDNVIYNDHISSWESSNIKITGGTVNADGLFELRNPMGFIMASNANVLSGQCWPAGSGGTILNHTQLFSDDVNYITFGFRGWAVFLNKVGLTFRKAVNLNQNNPNVSNRQGIQSLPDVPSLILSSATVSDSMLDFTPNGTSGTGWSVVYNRNITNDTAGVITTMNSTGAGNSQVASNSAAFQARFAAAKAQTIGTGFRLATPALASITPAATDVLTEQLCMDYAFTNPRAAEWYRILNGYVHAPLCF